MFKHPPYGEDKYPTEWGNVVRSESIGSSYILTGSQSAHTNYARDARNRALRYDPYTLPYNSN